jgi:tRNA (Thr-GGU) A37 N-methylase
VEKIDAFDGTPVIDIKPYLPGYDTTEGGKVPEWLERGLKEREGVPVGR